MNLYFSSKIEEKGPVDFATFAPLHVYSNVHGYYLTNIDPSKQKLDNLADTNLGPPDIIAEHVPPSLICGPNVQNNNSQDFSSLVSEVSSTTTLASQELDLMTLEDKFMQKVCIPGFINNFELFEL